MVYQAHNLSSMSNTTGIVSLFQSVNDSLMYGAFGYMILVVVFIIATISFLLATGNNVTKAITGAAFICFILSLFLRIMDLIPNYVIFVCLILTALSAVATRNS